MAQILLVGEERQRYAGLKAILALDGHRVGIARVADGWREDERASVPDVVVMSSREPHKLLAAPGRPARGFPPPVLVVRLEAEEALEVHLDDRIVDVLASPFAAEELLGRVDALARVRSVVLRHGPRPSGADAGETSADRSVRRLGGRFAALLRTRVPKLTKPPAPYLEVAARVAEWSDRRDGFEPGHAERVAALSAMIADELQLADGETAALLRAAMLHDIGKVALPVEILRHKGPLDDGQIRLLRTHAERGAAILAALDRDEVVTQAIRCHHESVDGSGYLGLTGEAIPRAARILAVAEAYDAMTTSLVRKPLSGEAALGVMQDKRGRQWDGACVDALTRALKPRPRSIALSPS